MQHYQPTTVSSLSHCDTTSLNALDSVAWRADLYLIALQTDSNCRDAPRWVLMIHPDGSARPGDFLKARTQRHFSSPAAPPHRAAELIELARVVRRQTGHTSRRHAASQNIHS